MNIREQNILMELKKNGFTNQRELSEAVKISLGMINKILKSLIQKGYLDNNIQLTSLANEQFCHRFPQKAIILAAGFGMRMTPINMEVPKALIEVRGEVLIERTIRQLKAAGIRDIYIVVGFMKEKFDYLIDQYGVTLIVNSEYATKNNLWSLYLAKEHLENAYIVPADIWLRYNPYRSNELYSWYFVSDEMVDEDGIRCNRKLELVRVSSGQLANRMIGISYLTSKDAIVIRRRLEDLCHKSHHEHLFWEEALYDNNKMSVYARLCSKNDVVEFNTYEQLRDFDSQSEQLKSQALDIISETFDATVRDITDITILKKGMTNRSFLFSCKGKRYIMRIPGEGTDKIINRQQEADVYDAIMETGICDNVCYMNSQTGYKITEFLENVRVCEASDYNDVLQCMVKLRVFHDLKLSVPHRFDLFEQITFYEQLKGSVPSIFKDYNQTKTNVLALKSYIEQYKAEECLCHIDAIPDNFLFSNGKIYLIDWEYAAMQDPHVDIAMFAIYSMYNRDQIDNLIDSYFVDACDENIRIKIYCYIAVCGLLWSNWCEYKRSLGVEFGEYGLRQYRYAKDFYNIVSNLLKERGETDGIC